MAMEAQSTPAATVTGSARLQSASARDRLATLFPDPSAPAPSWWHQRRKALIAVVVIALIGSGLLAAQAFGADNPSYVTATVATHNVDALLNGVALVEPVSQASVAFPASGTVSSVDVEVGDSVTVGQTLASLDPEQLTQALHEKQATLAQAELTLQKALNGEAVSGVGSGSGASSARSASAGGSTASAASSSSGTTVQLTAMAIPQSSNPQIAKAQQDVLAAQHKVDGAVYTSTQALDSATSVCAAAGIGTTPPGTPTAEQLTACQTATKNVLTAQTAVSAAQQQLVTASNVLDTLLTQQATTSTTTPSTSDPGSRTASGTPTGSGTGTGAGASTGASGSGRTTTAASSPSSADLIAYQKAVDAAAADVAVAEQAIAQATIVSPIGGAVQAVNLAVGDTVTAGSTTANIVVVGAGGYEVTTTVSVDKVTDVKVGQAATFLPDGSKRPLAGTVASISIGPDSSASTTSYRVVVGLTDPNAALDNGSTGSLAIVTKSSRSAIAVPTSAVTTIGSRHTVTVLKGGTADRTLVQVGVVGDTWTEIKGGVTVGQQVVLANLAEPLPGSATDSSSNSNSNTPGGRFGSFPGGGQGGAFPGGGFFARPGG